MAKVTIDDVEYDTDQFSDNGKAQLASLQFLMFHIRQLRAEISVYKTAHNSYLGALKAELAKGDK